jgi:hypothetical protein
LNGDISVDTCAQTVDPFEFGVAQDLVFEDSTSTCRAKLHNNDVNRLFLFRKGAIFLHVFHKRIR